MSPADTQQANEFMRWISETAGIGPEAVRNLCAFFYGRGVSLSILNLEEA